MLPRHRRSVCFRGTGAPPQIARACPCANRHRPSAVRKLTRRLRSVVRKLTRRLRSVRRTRARARARPRPARRAHRPPHAPRSWVVRKSTPAVGRAQIDTALAKRAAHARARAPQTSAAGSPPAARTTILDPSHTTPKHHLRTTSHCALWRRAESRDARSSLRDAHASPLVKHPRLPSCRAPHGLVAPRASCSPRALASPRNALECSLRSLRDAHAATRTLLVSARQADRHAH